MALRVDAAEVVTGSALRLAAVKCIVVELIDGSLRAFAYPDEESAQSALREALFKESTSEDSVCDSATPWLFGGRLLTLVG
jgi:hypothetical protein